MQIGGITAWLSIGEHNLEEISAEINDDQATCYVEVPSNTSPLHPSSPNALSPSTATEANTHGNLGSEYTINWRINDLTYTLVVNATIDGVLSIEKIHLGRGAITAARNTGRIDSTPVTDDWSKRRLLRFIKLQASESAPSLDNDVGIIKLSFYRAGKANISGGIKTSATGFHHSSLVDPQSLVKEAPVDALFNQSHATGLGPIAFGPPKKLPSVGSRDKHAYVTFTFFYRSRELILEHAPEDWTLAGPPPPANFNKDLPAVSPGSERAHPTGTMNRRPSLAHRAKKWASDVKHSAQHVRLPTGRGVDDSPNVPPKQDISAHIYSPPISSQGLEGIKDPFTPHSHVLARTPVNEVPVPPPHDYEPVPATENFKGKAKAEDEDETAD